MYTIREYDNFRLFLSTPQSLEKFKPYIIESEKLNSQYLQSQVNQKKIEVTPLKISGSFVYAHAPNYYGFPMLKASQAEWENELLKLKSFGVDTVIFQTSVWNELKECYYPSQVFKDFRIFDVVTPFLDAANKLGLTVFLGTYGSVAGWSSALSEAEQKGESLRHEICFKELYELYKGQFSGVYFTPETSFSGNRNPEKEECLHKIYYNFCRMIKRTDANLKIMMSPATFAFDGKSAEMAAFWSNLLQDIELDIMAPQDSVGCAVNNLPHMAEMFRVWAQICRENQIELWSNVEVFESCADETDLARNRRTAAPERIRQQMLLATSGGAKKLISWELMFYTKPEAGMHADALVKLLKA